MSLDPEKLKKQKKIDGDKNISDLSKDKNAKEKNYDIFGDGPPKKKKNKISLKERLVNIQTVGLRDKIFFVQNLRVMIRGGMSLGESLKTIANQTKNSLFQKILMEISREVEGGISFSDALGKYEKVFSNLFINMVKSGEMSGNLEDVLEKLHIQMKRDYELMSKVKGAMIYPLVVLVAMVGIGIAMIIFVVPKLMAIFEEVGAELPWATRALIGVSKFVTNNGILVAVMTIAFIVLFVKFYRSDIGKKFWHKVFLKTPIFSKIIKKINLARFCRTTSSLLKTDISIVDSLYITSLVVGNMYYKEALEDASKKIVKGLQINAVLSEYGKLFPPTVIQMLKVGEESGAVDSVLDEVALFYEEDVNQVMESLPSIIEPVMILMLGLGVGGMAVAIIMPMYSLSSAF